MAVLQYASCVELLADMVRIDTVNGAISGRPDAEKELAAFLEEAADSSGLSTRRLPVDGDSDNLLVWHQSAAAAPWLLFESHMDTVTAENMTVEPFAAEVRDGRMYGRGACDTKGTGAAMLWALAEYAAAGGGPVNAAIAFTVDEEIGKRGVRALCGSQLDAVDWCPAGVVVGEPTELQPVVAHNGIARWTIHTRGVAAHSAQPARGRSAISMMVRVIDAIEQVYAPGLTASHPLTGKAQCTVNVIRGGVQVNVIPEHCQIEVDRRVVPGEDGAAVVPAVEAVLERVRAAHPGLVVEQDEPYLDPPLDPAGGEAFAAQVAALLQSMGLPAQQEGVYYGTDASQFAQRGIPAVVLGPGSIEQAHTKDEWLALAELERGVQVYSALMRAAWT